MRKYLMAFAAFSALALFVPELADQYQAPKTLALGLAALAMLLVPSNRGTSMLKYLVAGLVAWTISAMFTSDRAYTMVGGYLTPFDGGASVMVYAGLLIGAARLALSPEFVARAVCWSSIPMSLYAVFQRFFHDPLQPIVDKFSDRVSSSQGGPVYLGAMLAVAFACGAYNIKRGNRRLGLITTILAAIALVFSGTRGGMLGAAAAVFILVPSKWRLAVFSCAAVALATHPRSLSDVTRMEIWKIAVSMFSEHPLLGYGPGTFAMAVRTHTTPEFVAMQKNSVVSLYHAHNILLHAAATTGIVGLIGLVTVLAGAWRVIRTHAKAELLLCVAAACAVVTAFNPAPAGVAAILALMVGSASSEKAKPQYVFRGVMVLACLGSLFLSTRIVMAEMSYYAAYMTPKSEIFDRAYHLNEAATWNPWELRFVSTQITSMENLAVLQPSRERAEILSACEALARHQVELHPADSSAYEIHGRSILVSSMAGLRANPIEALKQFSIAQTLAPTFLPLAIRRMSLARTLRMPKEIEKAEADVKRLSILEGRS